METTTAPKTTPAPAERAVPRARGRFAAIIDLENIAIMNDGRVSNAELQVLLNAIQPLVQGVPVRLATGISVLRPFMDLVGSQPWGLTLVPTEPDAADLALLAAADEFIHQGVTDIVVIGGDHAYVHLAARARLHVVSHEGHLSKALRVAASSVMLLPDIRPALRVAG